jgi:hypothetical protein
MKFEDVKRASWYVLVATGYALVALILATAALGLYGLVQLFFK